METLSEHIKMLRKIGLLLLAAVVVAGQGCGPAKIPRAIVRGRVTVKNKPVDYGFVTFYNAEMGIASVGIIEPDGSYEIKAHKGNGLPAGKYQVAITPRERLENTGKPFDAFQPSSVAKKPVPTVIPAKYHKAATSGLTATVVIGEERPFNFDL
jgi:hypothetical protein